MLARTRTWLALLPLAACGHSSDSATIALGHGLDLVDSAGRGALEQLAALEVEVAAWDLRAGLEQSAQLSYSGPRARLTNSADGTGGVRIEAAGAAELAPRLQLDFPGGDAPLFDAVELELVFSGGCSAAIEFEFVDGSVARVQRQVPFGQGRQRLRVHLGEALVRERRTIAGLRRLTLLPSLDQPRSMELFGLRLLDTGLDLGGPRQPAGPGEARTTVTPDEDPALLAFRGKDGRRSFPAAATSELLATMHTPPGARLSFALAPGPALATRGGRARVSLRAVAEPAPSGSPADLQVLLEHELGPADLDAGWLELGCDLDAFRGRELRLEFSVERLLESAPRGGDITSAPPAATGPEVLALIGAPRIDVPRNPSTPPHVVLVTFDTTRADVAADPAVAPHLAALAATGLTFTQAWSPSNTTTPAHGSLFTGLLPHAHGALAVGSYPLAAPNRTLAERFRAAGYSTAGAASIDHLDAAHGFAQGFERFLDPSAAAPLAGSEALRWAQAQLAEAAAGERPLFLWVHWFDPHTPYSPAPEVAGPGTPLPDAARRQIQLAWFDPEGSLEQLRADYRAGVLQTDALLGELIGTLAATGLDEHSLVAVTADHGEALGEDGLFASHAGLGEAVLRVPLVLRLPYGERAGERIDAPVASHDLFATLLELCRLEPPEPGVAGATGLDARSLLDPDPERVLWFESDRLAQVGRLEGAHLFSTTLRRTRLGLDPSGVAPRFAEPGDRELRRLSEPPSAGADSAAQPDAAKLEAWARAAQELIEGGAGTAVMQRGLSPAERERLRALGYLGDE